MASFIAAVTEANIMAKYRIPNAELEAMHHSRARGFGAIRPRNMDRMPITHEQAKALGDLVLGIFADMSNAGATLEETLRAIYMTGVENTLEIIKQNPTK